MSNITLYRVLREYYKIGATVLLYMKSGRSAFEVHPTYVDKHMLKAVGYLYRNNKLIKEMRLFTIPLSNIEFVAYDVNNAEIVNIKSKVENNVEGANVDPFTQFDS